MAEPSCGEQGCPFCRLGEGEIILANELAIAVVDRFPVTPGHSLVIPRRHVVSLFETTAEEREAIFDLVAKVRERLLEERQPDAFNIGINDGVAAGQTVMHLHVHLIPRYANDTDDPRGGVRWIMPVKAPYWKKG